MRLVIGRRLDRLGEQARKVLTAGAVIGRTFPLDLLQAVVDLSEDDVLDAIEEAERAQLVASDASQRSARYGFVHELIRTTLVNGLSLPRRQRLHLKIADALERLRAASIESHASVLAHHLYQAGAAADTDRTAKFLLLAGKRALAAGAFEETLETFDQLLGLELTEHDPLLAEACEHRGEALAGLRRYDEAVAAFSRALAIYIAVKDDAGIERAAVGEAHCHVWSGVFSKGQAPLTRGLEALSKNAARERALLLSWFGIARLSPAHVDEAWQCIDEAMAIAEHLGDADVLGQALAGLAGCQRMCCEYEAAAVSARRALPAIRGASAGQQADLLVNLLVSEFYLGHLETSDELLPELEVAAGRAGHHGALWLHERVQHGIEMARTGDLRAYQEASRTALGRPHFPYVSRSAVASCGLYLGAVDEALEQMVAAVAEQPADHWLRGMPEANLFVATALAGQRDRATALVAPLIPFLPVSGRRNAHGAFCALDALVTGLAVIGDRERLGRLYPLALAYLQTGHVFTTFVVGPSTPQLVAALPAGAAGMSDQAREHFEIALRQARDVPVRILQPTVLYWYGRFLSAATAAGEHARGRAMVEAALTDFRTLEMVLHAGLAEEFLREGR